MNIYEMVNILIYCLAFQRMYTREIPCKTKEAGKALRVYVYGIVSRPAESMIEEGEVLGGSMEHADCLVIKN